MQRSSRKRRWWCSAALVCLIALVQTVGAAEVAPDPLRLSSLVRQDCGSCHGLTLNGGLGKPLTVDELRPWDREQLILIILDGVPGTPMPGWRPLLTQAEAAWIADALKQGALQ